MLIIKVGDNENKRWKRSEKKKTTTTTKTEKNIGGQKLQWKAKSQIILLCV